MVFIPSVKRTIRNVLSWVGVRKEESKMPSQPINAEEKKYRAQDDAYILAKAEEIKADPERKRMAEGAAQQMVAEERERLKALVKVAGRRTSPIVGDGKTKTNTTQSKTSGNQFNVFQRIGK